MNYRNILKSGFALWLLLVCCMQSSFGQYQNEYAIGASQAYRHTLESITGNDLVVKTTQPSSSSPSRDILIRELDAATGAIMWEFQYNSNGNDLAFDAIQFGNGYAIVGMTDAAGIDEPLILRIDAGGGFLGAATLQNLGPYQLSHALHAEDVGDGSIVLVGANVSGYNDSDSKAGWAARWNPSSGMVWSKIFESQSTNRDFDLLGHVSVDDNIVFISGSANHIDTSSNTEQSAYGASLRLFDGALTWEVEYTSDPVSDDHDVASGSIIDQVNGLVYQLVNYSHDHTWGVQVFNLATGNHLPGQSFKYNSNLQIDSHGFEIVQDPNDPNAFTVGGYFRDLGSQVVNEDGSSSFISGTLPFLTKIEKFSGQLLWDRVYEIDSPGYVSGFGYFAPFGAGEHARIIFPTMFHQKQSGEYTVAAVELESGSYETTSLSANAFDGRSVCSSKPAEFSPATITFFRWINMDDTSYNSFHTTAGLQAIPPNTAITPCSNSQPCEAQTPSFNFQFDQDICGNVLFINTSPFISTNPEICFFWDFGNGNTFSGANPPLEYYANGTYTACLYAYCCDEPFDPATAKVTCKTFSLDCPTGDPCQDISLMPNIQAVFAPDCSSVTLTALNNGSTILGDNVCVNWDVVPGSSNPSIVTIPLNPDNCNFGACLTLYCCENPDIQLGICIDYILPCCEDCVIDAVDFNYDQISNTCRYAFAGNVNPTNGDYCYGWTIDGGLVSNDLFFEYEFDCTGEYEVCFTAYCCDPDTGEQTGDPMTICKTVSVDCGCNLPSAAELIATVQDDCNTICLDLITAGNSCGDLCILYSWGDGTNGADNCHTYAGNGVYDVCAQIFCCDDPTVEPLQVCTVVEINCDCTVPGPIDFTVEDLGDCTYQFDAVLPAGTNPDEHCLVWTLDGVDVRNSPSFARTFDCSGIYEMCLTVYCCVDGIDAPTAMTVCKTLEIDCGCKLPSGYDLTAVPQDDCETVCLELAYTDDGCGDFCIIYNWGDGTSSDTNCHTYAADGVYEVCARIFCCDDTTVEPIDICTTVTIDCGCEIEAVTFNYDQIGNSCTYAFAGNVFPADGSYCYRWTIDGAIVSNDPFFEHTFDCTGEYEVCFSAYCCDPATGEQLSNEVTFCEIITADCGCKLPSGYDLTAVPQDDCETVCLELAYTDDGCGDFCIIYNWGDGTSSDTNCHTYAADGVYEVCARIFCCDDTTVEPIDICTTVTIDCGCEIEAVTFNYDQIGNSCTYAFAGNVFPADGSYCYRWTIDGAIVSNDPFFEHTFDCTGEYEVCFSAYCCDPATGEQLSNEVTFCDVISVDCGCTLPSQISLTTVADPDDCKAICINLFTSDDGCGDYCVVYNFGDGSPQTDVNCHTYANNGTYTICAQVFCCDDPTAEPVEVCTTVVINCCEVVANFIIDNQLDGPCTYGFFGATTPGSTEHCYSWTINGETVPTTTSYLVHTFDCAGDYEICFTAFCCDDFGVPTGATSTVCETFTIDCGCQLPSQISLIPTATADCETVCVDLLTSDDGCGDYCVSYDWGDGAQSTDNCHTYLADGTYTVCARVYCCDDAEDTYQIVCTTVVIDCNDCEPDAYDWEYTTDGCEACFFVTKDGNPLGSDDCLLYKWRINLGPYWTELGVGPQCYTFPASGTYTVCLQFECCDDPLQEQHFVCKEITVTCPCDFDVQETEFTEVYSTADCFTRSYFVNAPQDGICYSWTTSDGGSGTGTTFNHTYAANGTYQICLTAYCCEDETNFAVHCQDVLIDCDDFCPKPCKVKAAFNQRDTGDCMFQFVNLSSAGDYSTINSYFWTFGDGNTSTDENPTHQYLSQGTYTVCLTVTASSPEGECEDTFCWEVTCGCQSDCEVWAGFDWNLADDTGCLYNFYGVGAGGANTASISYFWDFGNGNTSTDQNPTNIPFATGSYNVCLTVTVITTSGDVCEETICHILQVQCNGFDCEGEVKWDAEKLDNCEVLFTALPFVPGTIIDIQWNFSDGGTDNGGAVIHTFPGSGVYEVCVTVYYEINGITCAVEFCDEIEIECECECDGELILTGEYLYDCTYGFNIDIQVDDCWELVDFQWQTNFGLTGNSPSFTVDFPGPDTYKLGAVAYFVNGDQECKVVGKWELKINCSPEDVFFNLNGTKLAEVETPNLQVYPNPNDGFFNVLALEDQKVDNITVLDAMGKVVLELKEVADQPIHQIDLRLAGQGMYLVRAVCNGETLTKRIVIER